MRRWAFNIGREAVIAQGIHVGLVLVCNAPLMGNRKCCCSAPG
jgi:hypothetical protein